MFKKLEWNPDVNEKFIRAEGACASYRIEVEHNGVLFRINELGDEFHLGYYNNLESAKRLCQLHNDNWLSQFIDND